MKCKYYSRKIQKELVHSHIENTPDCQIFCSPFENRWFRFRINMYDNYPSDARSPSAPQSSHSRPLHEALNPNEHVNGLGIDIVILTFSAHGVGARSKEAQVAEHVPKAVLHPAMVNEAVAPAVAPQVAPPAA